MDSPFEKEEEESSSKAPQPELAVSAGASAIEDAKRYAHSTQTQFLLFTHTMIVLSTVFDVR